MTAAIKPSPAPKADEVVYVVRFVNRDGKEFRPRMVLTGNSRDAFFSTYNSASYSTGRRAQSHELPPEMFEGDFEGRWR